MAVQTNETNIKDESNSSVSPLSLTSDICRKTLRLSSKQIVSLPD